MLTKHHKELYDSFYGATHKNEYLDKRTEVLVGLAAAMGMRGGASLDSEISAERDLQGKGNANQSNSLTGSISVTVVEVFTNGNLKVRGEKRVSLNQGSEYIRVSGIIRSTDITATNQVKSSQLADATIMYTGDGAIADASRMGWGSRLFMHWIFPF